MELLSTTGFFTQLSIKVNLLYILIFLVVFDRLATAYSNTGLECNASSIEILVSPMMSRSKIREMELQWNVKNSQPDDWVAFYDKDPILYDSATPLFKSDVQRGKNWVQTNVQEKHDLPSLPFSSMCLGYWAVYWRNKNKDNSNEMIAYSCLRTYPTWMEDSKPEIEYLKLKDMFIPGTHDSCADIIAQHSFKETIFQKYVYTQDEDVLDQLIMGARYLDVRVGLYKDVYWANHGRVSLHPLSEVLEKVKTFIDNTNEIVIIDFHRFPVGFKTDSERVDLANYVINNLHDYLAENTIGWHATLRDIWHGGRDSKRRLIISFNNELLHRQFMRFSWPPISHVWAETDTPEKLYVHLNQHMQRGKLNYLWAAMAELTPDTWSVVKYRKGLREMAYKVNKDISTLFEGRWANTCNVVAVDFLRSTGIVQSAIRANKCRGKV